MKRIAVLMMMAGMLASAMPCTAAETGKEEKDLCLLYGTQCKERVDSIQEKIRKLQAEIAKGEKVYSPMEILRLQQKLHEANELLDNLLYGGGKLR